MRRCSTPCSTAGWKFRRITRKAWKASSSDISSRLPQPTRRSRPVPGKSKPLQNLQTRKNPVSEDRAPGKRQGYWLSPCGETVVFGSAASGTEAGEASTATRRFRQVRRRIFKEGRRRQRGFQIETGKPDIHQLRIGQFAEAAHF